MQLDDENMSLSEVGGTIKPTSSPSVQPTTSACRSDEISAEGRQIIMHDPQSSILSQSTSPTPANMKLGNQQLEQDIYDEQDNRSECEVQVGMNCRSGSEPSPPVSAAQQDHDHDLPASNTIQWVSDNHANEECNIHVVQVPDSPTNSSSDVVECMDDDHLVVNIEDEDRLLDSDDDSVRFEGCSQSVSRGAELRASTPRTAGGASCHALSPNLSPIGSPTAPSRSGSPVVQPPQALPLPPPSPPAPAVALPPPLLPPPPQAGPAVQHDAQAGFIPTTTFSDAQGRVRLRFDPEASPFQVRNQILAGGYHRIIDHDLAVIRDRSTHLRPCLPYQNLSCVRIVPVHGSLSTDLVFNHICLLCLYSQGIPLPHPLVNCPFANNN